MNGLFQFFIAALPRLHRPARLTEALKPILMTAFCILFFAAATNPVYSSQHGFLLETAGGWKVSFDTDSSVLECQHPDSGITLKGRLSFVATHDGKSIAWSVQSSHDSFLKRIALVDDRGNAQGYIAVTGNATKLSLTLLHRPPQDYEGELRFTPEIQFGSNAFACRTRVKSDSAVIQMASGPADSALNDSLFDAERDLLLRINGEKFSLTTFGGATNTSSRFQAECSATIASPDASTITFELLPHYYQSRYVPNYRPIDRKRCPKAPTGWMAWNIYFDLATEDDNLAEARVGAKYLKPFGLEFWSIESWQENSERLVSRVPVSEFHNLTLKASDTKFPHGMKWMSEQIRSLGFRPGIWAVSFGTGDESFYKEHHDWFLHDRDGKPMHNWSGRFVLDPSQAAVRKFTEETHRLMSADWGYEFFKCDGMSGEGPGLSAHFFERPEVRAAFHETCENPYAQWIETLRRGIGPDRVLLACQGHYTGPEVGLVDAARIGGDIVVCGHTPPWSGRQGYLRQAHATQNQLFVNNLVWYNDPDTLLVGDFATLDVARVATTVVALPGQLTFFGDKLTRLAPDRMRLLQQTLPVCDVHPMDLVPRGGELMPIWDLKVSRPFAKWDVVSLFNWTDIASTQSLIFTEIGLDDKRQYLLFDFWNHKFLGSCTNQMEFKLEPRSNCLLTIHPDLNRPQFLSTDRHISQGGVELADASWNPEQLELDTTFKLVENDRLTAYFHIPPSFLFTGATADGADIKPNASEASNIISISLCRPTSGETCLRLIFRKK